MLQLHVPKRDRESRIHRIDDPDDRAVHRDEGGIQRQGSFPAAHQEYEILRPRGDGVYGYLGGADRLLSMIERLNEEKSLTLETFVFALTDDGADHAPKIHGALSTTSRCPGSFVFAPRNPPPRRPEKPSGGFCPSSIHPAASGRFRDG